MTILLRRLRVLPFIFFMLLALTVRAEKIGLVLSGGGAKGIAHIGVIQALEDNGIPIDYITGTSMGAVVGGLYSCGMSPARMLRLVTSSEFANWSTGRIDPNLTYYFDKQVQDPSLVKLQIDPADSVPVSANILPGALINPLPMNFAFMQMFAPYTAQCDSNFNRLFVPFRCVASDVYHKHKIVLSSGSLSDAIRASMSFPMVYKPIEMNGVLVYDGGIYDNFPVDVMEQDFNPGFIIGVSVSGPDTPPEPGNMYQQLEDMIIQNNDYSVPPDKGIKIQVPVTQFAVLDFPKGRQIYEIGYRTGLQYVDSIKSRIKARVSPGTVERRRAEWDSLTPPLVFDSVAISGLTPGQTRYVRNLFTERGRRKTFDVQQARDVYYRLISSGKISQMRPTAVYEPASGMFSLDMDVRLKKKWNAGVGGWLTSSTNSMLYLSTGYHTLSYRSLDAVAVGWIGQSYYGGYLCARFSPASIDPSYVELQAAATHSKYYDSDMLFYKTDNPSFVNNAEQYIRANWAMALGRNHKGLASLGYGWEHYSFYPQDAGNFATARRDKANYRVAAAKLEFSGSTLNNELYPSSGSEIFCGLWGLYERSSFVNHASGAEEYIPPSYSKLSRFRGVAEVRYRHFFPLHRRFALGVTANLLGSLGKLGGDYIASMIYAPGFGPTPSTKFYFNTVYRAYNYVAVGINPVWTIIGNLQLRGDFYLFEAARKVKRTPEGKAAYGSWFSSPQFLGEVAGVYNFSFASLAVYCNFLTSAPRHCNVGVSFGIPFTAPRFLR